MVEPSQADVVRVAYDELEVLAPNLTDSLRQYFDSLPGPSDDRYFLIARLDESVIALASIEYHTQTGRLEDLYAEYSVYIDPESQRRGLGSKMLGFASAVGTKTRSVWLEVVRVLPSNEPAKCLARSAGFRQHEGGPDSTGYLVFSRRTNRAAQGYEE